MKRIAIGIVILLLVMVINGCGNTGTSINNPKLAPVSNQSTAQEKNSNQNIAQSQVTTKPQEATNTKIDIKSTQGQAKVDQQIDSKLQSLDHTLDKLDKSMGELQ